MDKLTQIALGWLEDCFPGWGLDLDYFYGHSMPDDLTTDEVWDAIARHYEGGVAQFIADGQDEDDKEFDDSDVDCFYNDEEGGA